MKAAFEGIEDDRQDWEKWRVGRVGSSTISTIVGLNKYQSAYQLWAEWTGKAEAQPAGDAAKYGQLVEPAIQQFFEYKFPQFKVLDCQTSYQHEHHDWAVASPDSWLMPQGEGVIEESTGEELKARGILECKHTAADFDAWVDGIPDAYHCQVQWQMGVTATPYCYVAAVVGGRAADLKSVYVGYDPDIFNTLLEKAIEFKKCVDTDTPPEVVAADSKLLDKLTEWDDKTVELDTSCGMLIQEYENASDKLRDAKREVSHYDSIVKDCKTKLKQKMGSAKRAITPDGKVLVVREIERSGFTMPGTKYTTLTLKEK